MNDTIYKNEVIAALEKDPLLLKILGDVLLFDPGSPDVPYSQPIIPRDCIIARLIDYLSSNGSSEFMNLSLDPKGIKTIV